MVTIDQQLYDQYLTKTTVQNLLFQQQKTKNDQKTTIAT